MTKKIKENDKCANCIWGKLKVNQKKSTRLETIFNCTKFWCGNEIRQYMCRKCPPGEGAYIESPIESTSLLTVYRCDKCDDKLEIETALAKVGKAAEYAATGVVIAGGVKAIYDFFRKKMNESQQPKSNEEREKTRHK